MPMEELLSLPSQRTSESNILIVTTFNRKYFDLQILKTLDKAIHEMMHKAKLHTLLNGVEF